MRELDLGVVIIGLGAGVIIGFGRAIDPKTCKGRGYIAWYLLSPQVDPTAELASHGFISYQYIFSSLRHTVA